MRIIQRHTPLRVLAAADNDWLEAGRIYLAPSDRHLRVTKGGRIASTDHRKINYLKSSAEPVLESVASLYGARAIAVILSGSGKNGSQGAKQLHDVGGVVLAQDQATSRNFGMPGAAIAIGAVDRVLPVQEIASTLTDLVQRS